jgi:hypothetical protein
MALLSYNPRQASVRTNAIVWTVFCVLLGGAFWVSLTATLDEMTQRDCKLGIQKACKAMK